MTFKVLNATLFVAALSLMQASKAVGVTWYSMESVEINSRAISSPVRLF
jgi:hypothetical protein